MSCCGKWTTSMRYDPHVDVRDANRWSAGRTELVFSGPGRLIVTGPLTGIEYQFDGGGPPLRVHPWDVRSMTAIPGLTLAHQPIHC
jgi:hypothetical protein